MGVRQWINEHSTVATLVVVVALCGAVGTMVWTLRGDSGSLRQEYYYDMQTGQLFTATYTAVPPVASPHSGGQLTGARAAVFGCGGCPKTLESMTREEAESAGAIVTWIEWAPEEVRGGSTQPASPSEARLRGMDGQFYFLVQDLDSDRPVRQTSDAGRTLTTRLPTCPDGSTPQRCTPND
ncbi:MAG: hypothetical protein WD534_02740 [Phycisphaeraceae bacterium]